MPPALFQSAERFRDDFEQGLVGLLRATGEVGEDVLVLANANYEPRIWFHLKDELRACFSRLQHELAEADRSGKAMPAAPDDVATLRQIIDHDFDSLRPTETRHAGPWELQFNPLRAYRPARHSNARVEGIRADFDEARFHFDKPFLKQEFIWEGELLGRAAALLYNKFPFADYHGLLVPDIGDHRPQYLEPADIDYLWRVGSELGERMPGFGLGFNSYGAHASVNQLHFQTFLREEPLPVENPDWTHNGGGTAYPIPCLRCATLTEANAALAELHRRLTSYNLIFSSGVLYCLPRQHQGEFTYAPWLSTLAWFEMAGGFPLASEADYLRLDATEIAAQVSRASLDR